MGKKPPAPKESPEDGEEPLKPPPPDPGKLPPKLIKCVRKVINPSDY